MTQDLAEKNIEEAFAEVDDVILKRFLDTVGELEVVASTEDVAEAVKSLRLDRLTKLVYDKDEDNLDKLNGVFAAMHHRGASVVAVLQSDGSKTDLFLGTGSSEQNSSAAYDAVLTLQSSLNASFPGFCAEELYAEDLGKVCTSFSHATSVASVVGVPSLKDEEKKSFVQGLDKIVDGMSGQKYTAIIIAAPVSRHQLELVEASYQQLYSTLALMAENQITLSKNESKTLGQSLSQGISKTITNSIAYSQSITEGTTDTTTDSVSKSKSRSRNYGSITAASGVAAGGAGGALLGAPLGPPGMFVGFALGSAAGGMVGSIGNALFGSTTKTSSISESNSHGVSHSETEGKTASHSEANGETITKAVNEGATSGTGQSLQFTVKDRRVLEWLEIIDEQLQRIRDCKNYGMWNWGAYFVGDSLPVVRMGANIYSGILTGESTGIERSAITTWTREEDTEDSHAFDELLKYLCKFQHPVLKAPEGFSFASIMPCSLVSTKEAAVGMSLPQKSLPGIPVMEAVSFGRAVSRHAGYTPERTLEVGRVSHLGQVEENHAIELDIDSLTAHAFITGSTGAGKSNVIYSLLHGLKTKYNVPFLVVEPAKSEYKEVFGGLKGVSVYGTNPYLTPLLHVNPFSFPQEIHVVEHIDRLIDILNAVWPMYAAMPAILKDAVEQSYEKLGWDLLTSTNSYGRIFPDFEDLLDVLPSVIETSDYSEELKGNYTGSLVTRVRSLTNGYYRAIFQKEELKPEKLFDASCVVDLSRVGSVETKSLLMGIIFMKLQEHRMANAEGANTKLKHITVLEEAHNLLRRTSADQNQEGANLQGKSVEMISNAIAEMRTYGEGFIIADQAPNLLDESVIRNTNTKMVLRLPDWDDRELVGRAANLKDEHLEELARLQTGCAALYQNDWNEAVLCQFPMFDANKHGAKFIYEKPDSIATDSRKKYRTQLLKVLIMARQNEQSVEAVAEQIDIDLMGGIRQYFPQVVDQLRDGKGEGDWLLYHISQILHLNQALRKIPHGEDFDCWTTNVLRILFSWLDRAALIGGVKERVVSIIFECMAEKRPDEAEMWLKEIDQATKWKEKV